MQDVTPYILLTMGLLAECGAFQGPQAGSPEIGLPYQWVGNIDKIEFREPSGICWHSQRETLFVVGDEGDICEIKTDGTLIKQKRIRHADFEGITHDPATGLLYVAVEGAESILEISPETFEVSREFSLPRTLDDRTVLKSGGQGIEGITFLPEPSHPEGGEFRVANQAFSHKDEQDISAVFRVQLPLRSKTGKPELLGYFKPPVVDLSGLYYDPASDQIFVISDAADIIIKYSRNHEFLQRYALPGYNQEGITFDNAGFMYIAQDSGGIIKLKVLPKSDTLPPPNLFGNRSQVQGSTFRVKGKDKIEDPKSGARNTTLNP